MLKIEVLNTSNKGKRFRFTPGMTIGSGEKASIRAQHLDMSDIHVRFYLDDNKPMIETVAKDPHLFVNGKDVLRCQLNHNDEFQVGPLRFRALDENLMSSSSLKLDQLTDPLTPRPRSTSSLNSARPLQKQFPSSSSLFGASAMGSVPPAMQPGHVGVGVMPTPGTAIASLVLGITALLSFFMCFGVFAIPGVICGHMALGKIRRSGGQLQGRGMALAGLVISYATIVIGLVLVLLFGLVFGLAAAGQKWL